jgi:hypothetical protein
MQGTNKFVCWTVSLNSALGFFVKVVISKGILIGTNNASIFLTVFLLTQPADFYY